MFRHIMTPSSTPVSAPVRPPGVESKAPATRRPPQHSTSEDSYDCVDGAVPLGFETPGEVPHTVQSDLKMLGKLGRGVMSKGKLSVPRKLQTTPVVKHTYRFRVTQTGSYSVTTGSISGACGAMGITSTTVQNIASSIHVNKLTIWPPATAIGTSDTVMVYWNYSTSAGFVKDESYTASLPDGITTTGAMTFKPPKKSLLSDWLSTTLSFGNTAMTIAAPAGSIIDLDVSFTLMNNNSGYSATTVSTATVGRIYYLPLDGVSSNKIQAQGITTTA